MTDSDPSDMDSDYKIFRKGFLESAEGWNGEMYHYNPESYERRLQARFEALKESGEFAVVSVEALQKLHSDMLDTAQLAGSQGAYQTANVVESFAEDVEALIEDCQ